MKAGVLMAEDLGGPAQGNSLLASVDLHQLYDMRVASLQKVQ